VVQFEIHRTDTESEAGIKSVSCPIESLLNPKTRFARDASIPKPTTGTASVRGWDAMSPVGSQTASAKPSSRPTKIPAKLLPGSCAKDYDYKAWRILIYR
jgi:hypothetical protein